MLVGTGGSQDELVHMPPRDTPGSPDTSEAGSARCGPTFDLLNMVVSYRRTALFLEPLWDVLELLRFLLGWKLPLCSLLVCLLLNILFLTVSQGAWFCVCLLGVAAPASLGYLQDRCGGGLSEAELQRRRYHAVQRRDLQEVRLSKQEAMMEVKELLKQLDDLLQFVCQTAEGVYKVLYWDHRGTSCRFYGLLLLVLVLLHTAPLGWVLVGLNSALFLWNRDCYRVLGQLREAVQPGLAKDPTESEQPEAEKGAGPDRSPTPSVEDLSPGSVEEAEEAEPDEEFKDAIEEPHTSLSLQVWPFSKWRHVFHRRRAKEDEDTPLGNPEYDTSDNGLLSRNEPIRSKVSKLTEKLRKRYPTTATGSCSSCSAVFSVLKKRRSCSNCGNSFCSRCCSYRVLRSSMGATAPEAQRETVFVCSSCNTSLSKLL